MQVQRVQNNCYDNFNKTINYNKIQNISNINNTGFHGRKSQLISASADSFKLESAKKIYSKIQRYLKLLGNSGSIANVKIMEDKWRDFNYKAGNNFCSDSEINILLSIKKSADKTYLNLSREYPDKSIKTVLDALFNKNGQMVKGSFPLENLQFERFGANVRRMKSKEKQYLPASSNDREWNYLGDRIASSTSDKFLIYHPESKDNPASGAFEIFLELARLKTSIM